MNLFSSEPISDQRSVGELHDFYGATAELSVGSTVNLSIPLILSSRPGGGLNDSQRPAFLVRCGSPSGLYVIIFSKQERAVEFLASNPVAAKTMITLSLANGVIFWCRFQSEQIVNVNTSDVALCSRGLVPFSWYGEDLDNRFFHAGLIAEVDWSTLKWDPSFQQALKVARMESTLGPMFVKLGPRKVGLNDAIVCRGFADENNIVFDPEADQFFRRTPTGELEPVPEKVLLEHLTVWLQRRAANSIEFPQREMRLVRLKLLIEYLKLVTALSRPSLYDHVHTYLRKRLYCEPGSNLTVDEIQVDFFQYAKENNIGQYPVCKLSRELPRLIRTMFGVIPSHDIRRWNDEKQKSTNRRGFRKITFRASDPSVTSEASDSLLK